MFLARRQFRIDHPPGRLPGSLVRDLLELLMQREVVSDGVLPAGGLLHVPPLSEELEVVDEPLVDHVEGHPLAGGAVDGQADQLGVALRPPGVSPAVDAQVSPAAGRAGHFLLGTHLLSDNVQLLGRLCRT